MAKKNKVTLKAIREVLGERPADTSTFTVGTGENAVTVTVKQALSFDEKRDMVNGIVDMLFIDDGENGEQYCPYLKKFSLEYHIISYFTNIKFPAKAEEIWDFLYTTDVANLVMCNLPAGVVEKIVAEANEMIEFRKLKLVKQSKLEDVLSGIMNLVQTLNKKLEGADGKAIMNYLEQNIPDFKGELQKVFQEEVTEQVTE